VPSTFGSNPYASGRHGPKDKHLRVVLACGHSIRTALRPSGDGAVYACAAKEGCGYRLGWLSWSDVRPGQELTVFNSRYQ
jgi:hypothetical protein